MVHKLVDLQDMRYDDIFITPAYGGRAMSQPVPKYELPEEQIFHCNEPPA